MLIMILCSRWSTSSRVQLSRSAFCDISNPLVATPPALAALAGPYSTLASRKHFVAGSVLGILAPSDTQMQPFLVRLLASFSLISFCVADGSATSHFTCQSALAGAFGSTLW